MALTLRSILLTAVPALTALVGIFWFSRRRKKPPMIAANKDEDDQMVTEERRGSTPPRVILTQPSDEGKVVTELVTPSPMVCILEDSVTVEAEYEAKEGEDRTPATAMAASVSGDRTQTPAMAVTEEEFSCEQAETQHTEELQEEEIIISSAVATISQSPTAVPSGDHSNHSDNNKDKQTDGKSVPPTEVSDNTRTVLQDLINKPVVNSNKDSSHSDVKLGSKTDSLDEKSNVEIGDSSKNNSESSVKTDSNIKQSNVKLHDTDVIDDQSKMLPSPVTNGDVDSELDSYGVKCQGHRKRKLSGDADWYEESASPDLAASPVGNGSASTNGSETSIDSGIVAAASPKSNVYIYEFNFPTELCGLLIGSRGKNIKQVMDKTGAQIIVKKKMYDPLHQLVCVEGSRASVDKTMELFHKKFPPKKFPMVDLTPAPPDNPILSSEIMQLGLPQGVGVDVIVSSVVTANHVFVQQPTHPQFPMLEKQNLLMNECYGQDGIVPQLPRPIEVGVICAAPMYNGWYRAQVVQTGPPEQDEVDLRFVDYGGYCKEPGSALRQIRSDFTTLPFQAVECYLANVIPPQDSEVFPTDANALLEQLVHGQIVQAHVIGHETDGVPYINLYVYRQNKLELINRELVDMGVAQWLESY